MQFEKSAGIVIFRTHGKNREFLLLHYPGGHWDFVKGHIEKGEEELTTARRECKEETGITDLKFVEGFKKEIQYFFRRGKNLIKKEVVFYLAETKTKEIKLSHEHIGFAWLPYEDAIERLTFDNAKEVLKEANKFLANL